jgi:hypothetical protein
MRLCCENYFKAQGVVNCSELCSYSKEAPDKLRLTYGITPI